MHHLCRTALNVRPVAAALFGLRATNARKSTSGPPWLWLSPDQSMDKLDREAFPSVELRIRFKLPTPLKLHELDRQAFSYYYRQV